MACCGNHQSNAQDERAILRANHRSPLEFVHAEAAPAVPAVQVLPPRDHCRVKESKKAPLSVKLHRAVSTAALISGAGPSSSNRDAKNEAAFGFEHFSTIKFRTWREIFDDRIPTPVIPDVFSSDTCACMRPDAAGIHVPHRCTVDAPVCGGAKRERAQSKALGQMLSQRGRDTAPWHAEVAPLGLPWGRLLGGMALLGGIALNAFTIVRAWARDPLPDPLVGMARGLILGDVEGLEKLWGLFTLKSAPDSHLIPGEADTMVLVRCLQTCEMVILCGSALVMLWRCSYIYGARVHVSTRSNFVKWKSVANGFEWLQYLATCNVFKALPRLKERPKEFVLEHKLRKDKLTKDDGVLSFCDKVSMISYAIWHMVGTVALVVFSMIALFLKLEALESHTKGTPRYFVFEASTADWLAFAGFANQLMGMVCCDATLSIRTARLAATQLFPWRSAWLLILS
jgi:hypothetical protein